MATQNPSPPGSFPEAADIGRFIRNRRQRGLIWRLLFQLSTLVGIIALTALLLNIINSAFGAVAVQNKVTPESLVLAVEQQRMLTAPNLVSSEDDDVLAAGVAADPWAIGFFGYAYYQEHADSVKILSLDGVLPSSRTVDDASYSLSRPLYIYSSQQILREKAQAAAFVDYYLEHVQGVIEGVGYFPASQESMEVGWRALWQTIGDKAPAPSSVTGRLHIAGSSTLYPLTRALLDGFQAAGYPGTATHENVGTSAGLVRFCREGDIDIDIDIVNASRAMNRAELELCRQARRTPVEFRVGTDAIAVVVSRQNRFLDGLTTQQLRAIFAGDAATWAEVEPSWPDQPIRRFIPGSDSGTLDFFGEQLFDRELADLPKETLVAILEANVSAGLMRRLENDQPFAQRSQENIYQLVVERVVQPKIVRSWSLADSLLRPVEIESATAEIPNGELSFRSWLNPSFLRSPQASVPDQAGVRTAILGSLWTILITIVFSLPIGVGAAIFLEEYSGRGRLNRLIETNINNLAGVPSIIYGMLGLAIFVRMLEPLTSGSLFGATDPTTANGRTVLAAGLTLGLLILPLIIINAREAIRSVPSTLRQASYGLGATQWQTIWHHVLPNAMAGILTGTILAVSRAIGETAPLVVIGASTFIVVDPSGPFAKFTTLPIQIYQWTSRPQDEFRNIAAAAILVLILLLLTLNASAVLLRNRYSTRSV